MSDKKLTVESWRFLSRHHEHLPLQRRARKKWEKSFFLPLTQPELINDTSKRWTKQIPGSASVKKTSNTKPWCITAVRIPDLKNYEWPANKNFITKVLLQYIVNNSLCHLHWFNASTYYILFILYIDASAYNKKASTYNIYSNSE